MPCPQCERLTAELKIRERDHVMAVRRVGAVGEMDIVTLHKLRAQLSDARMEHELARLLLKKHQLSHPAALTGLNFPFLEP
jgi:hypothetical protein